MLIKTKTYYFIMSDSVFSNTIDYVKGNVHESSKIERNWWKSASTEAKQNILDITRNHYYNSYN